MKFQILDCAGEDQPYFNSFRSINIKDFEDLFNLNANFCILQIDLSQKESAYLNSLNKNIDTNLNKTNSF